MEFHFFLNEARTLSASDSLAPSLREINYFECWDETHVLESPFVVQDFFFFVENAVFLGGESPCLRVHPHPA